MRVKSVLVCGLPGSGNRLVKRLVKAAGARQVVFHFLESDAFDYRGPLPPLAYLSWTSAICPVRDERIRALSREKIRSAVQTSEVKRCEGARERREAWCKENGVPLFGISYRRIVEHPEEARREILDFCVLRDTQWPSPIYDGDVKYQEAN